MSKIDDGGPAFPVSTRPNEFCEGNPVYPVPYAHQDGPNTIMYGGMTLRDYFAAKALVACGGNVAFTRTLKEWRDTEGEAVAQKMLADYCYQLADAMISARKIASE